MTDDLLSAAKGRPKCVALVICDSIIEDKETNSKSLIGLFNTIAATALPTVHSSLCLFSSFGEGLGTWDVHLIFIAPSGAQIIKFDGEVAFANENESHDIVLKLRGFPLAEFGTYRVDVLVRETLVASRQFNVVQAQLQ